MSRRFEVEITERSITRLVSVVDDDGFFFRQHGKQEQQVRFLSISSVGKLLELETVDIVDEQTDDTSRMGDARRWIVTGSSR